MSVDRPMIDETFHARPESVMVKLTRMEGKLDNLTERINDLRPRVDIHGAEITTLCLRVQSLELGAGASREMAANKSALGWAPVTKVFAVTSALLVAVVLYQTIVGV